MNSDRDRERNKKHTIFVKNPLSALFDRACRSSGYLGVTLGGEQFGVKLLDVVCAGLAEQWFVKDNNERFGFGAGRQLGGSRGSHVVAVRGRRDASPHVRGNLKQGCPK